MVPVLPPSGSGLATLGTTCGIYQNLENLLQPVSNTVSGQFGQTG